MPARSIRTEKLDLRLTRDAKRKLRAAAEMAHRSVSEFVLATALTRADEVLGEQRRYARALHFHGCPAGIRTCARPGRGGWATLIEAAVRAASFAAHARE